jgi:PTH1 family peptidyl-tRNA hydrolase
MGINVHQKAERPDREGLRAGGETQMVDESTSVKPQSATKRVLIVGLGNPGREHRQHRHNIGFMVVDYLAEQHHIALSRVQMKAIMGSGTIAGRPVILAKPQTYMNRSGEVVGGLARFYQIDPPQLLVIYDELDLPFGTLRLRKQGGAGGHNGMRSVIQNVGQGFPRLRLGIGRPPGRMPPAAYVLQRFNVEELPVVEELLDEALRTIDSFLTVGVDLAMTRHNGSVVDPPS